MKAGNNSYKPKNEIRQMLYLFYSHNKITKKQAIIMAVHIGENKFVITTEPKTFYFDLPKVVGIILKYENYFIIKHNEPLAEHTIKKEIRRLLSKYNYENDIINMAKSKTNEPHKFLLHYSQRLDLKRSNKHVAHQNLSIYYTQKNIRQQCENSKLKVIGSI